MGREVEPGIAGHRGGVRERRWYRPSELRALMLARVADASEVPSLRTIRRWCETGAVRARRLGPKLWQIDLRSLKESRESMAIYQAATEMVEEADDDAAE